MTHEPMKHCGLHCDDAIETKKLKISRDLFIFHPNGKFKMYWDLIIIILTIYNVVLVPYEVGYETKPIFVLRIFEIFID
jgi:hypothetical protein